MGKIIAVAGKGGTGKTTISALIVRALMSDKKKSVLAVDADPNSTLAESLGLEVDDTISGICEYMLENKESLPAGMTKERFLEYKIQESLIEKDNLALLTMGMPEGSGCYCYANNLLRGIVKDLYDSYSFTVVDNEAGMEHLSRKTMKNIDALFIVSDFSIIGVKTASRIFKLTKQMQIKLQKSFLMLNKVKGDVSKDLEKEVKDTGLVLAANLPYSSEIEDLSISSKSIFDLPDSSELVNRIKNTVEELAI